MILYCFELSKMKEAKQIKCCEVAEYPSGKSDYIKGTYIGVIQGSNPSDGKNISIKKRNRIEQTKKDKIRKGNNK